MWVKPVALVQGLYYSHFFNVGQASGACASPDYSHFLMCVTPVALVHPSDYNHFFNVGQSNGASARPWL